MKNQKKKDKSYLLAVALLLLAGFFIFLFFLPEGKGPSNGLSSQVQSQQFEEKVNKHLFNTSQSIQLSKEKMELETNKMAHDGVGSKVVSKEDLHKLDFSADPRAEALLKELGRDVKEPNGPTNSDEDVQADLFEAQQYHEYSEAYKKEYARQFVENARKAGYIIKLNDEYKVISVKPLRKPAENFELFKGQGGGAQ